MRTGRAGEVAERVWPFAALALGMVILGAAAASGHLFGDADAKDGTFIPAVTPTQPTDAPTVRPSTAWRVGEDGFPWVAVLVAASIACAVLLVLMGLFHIRFRLRARPNVPLLEPSPAPPGESAPTLQEDLLEQARIAQALVHGASDIRDAVIAAYVSFEGAVARGGVARLAHETSGDLLNRVLRSTAVPEQAAAELVALYERVRFGTVDSDEVMRADAQRCLSAIEQSLAGVPR
jgi:hypothetical protein